MKKLCPITFLLPIPIVRICIGIVIVGMTACTGSQEADEQPPALFEQPKTVALNTNGGYVVNTVTGDTIQPLINSLGDTVKTGIPIPAVGKVISPESVAQPKRFVIPPVTELSKKDAHPNVHIIPQELTIIPMIRDSLKVIPIENIAENDTEHYLINRTGDTIRTGIPIPAKGKSVNTTQSQPIPALAMRLKDAVINDIQYVDVDQGMATSYVYSIIEDKSGNLWFGTEGCGVSRYDGKSFIHFTEKEGLSNNYVHSILEDKSGNLWFGTGGGVSRYDGKSFTHFTEKEGLSSNVVISILEDRSGNLWFGTAGGGVNRYDGKSITHFTKKEGLSSNVVLSIIEDKSGNLWFGTYGGVSNYDGKSFTHFTEKEGLSKNEVRSILEDESGNLWFGTEGGGVSRYDGKSFTHFTEKEGLSNDFVRSIMEDKNGNLWFGTYGGGVCRYDEKSFTHFTEKEGLSNDFVRSILEDKSGNLWFGTEGGGVNRYDGNSFTHFTEKEGLSNDNVLSILEDKSGNLWFGTADGVSWYDGKSFTHFTVKEGLSGNNISSILEDKSGNLWFGIWGGGVSRYDGKSFTHFTEKEGLSNNFVRSIIEDKSGNLWFGTWGGGVCRYDGKSFTHFTEKEGLSSNFLRCISEDKSGNLWFGTLSSGVSRYDGKSFLHFTEKEGLSNNRVWSFVADESGAIWVGTDNGLDQFVPVSPVGGVPDDAGFQQQEVTYKINRLAKNDGLNSAAFFANSVCMDNKNRIWWGSGKSLTMLNLNEYTTSQNPPVVFLRQLDINEQFIDYRNISDSLMDKIAFSDVQTFENYPLNPELPYDKNHLTFHFAAVDWAAPHKIRFSYLMDGLNTEWSKPSEELKADYRNLPYGTYTFKVRAIGESGEWSEPFEYTFTINPPWWHTWWARTGYGIAALLLLFGTVRWRTASLRQRQKELEKEVDKATKEIREEKERSENLLLNILPEKVASELKEKGQATAKTFGKVSVLFADFKDFTKTSDILPPEILVSELDHCFRAFDTIMEKHGLEKIKTIGDAYLSVAGIPEPKSKHALMAIRAALDMKDFIQQRIKEREESNEIAFQVRVGIHSGPVVAGVVGSRKFTYDIWGDTVNIAQRMETNCEPGKVNVSFETFKLIKDNPSFEFESRGNIEVKGKGEMEMYFVSLRNSEG